MKVLTMDGNEKVEIGRKTISRAIEFEHFDRPLSGFVALELFFFCMGLGFTGVVLLEEVLFGGMDRPGFTELVWTLILGVVLLGLLYVLMDNFPIFKMIVLLGFSVLWTFLIVLGLHNVGVGIGGLIGAGIIGFALSTFFHFVGFEALNE